MEKTMIPLHLHTRRGNFSDHFLTNKLILNYERSFLRVSLNVPCMLFLEILSFNLCSLLSFHFSFSQKELLQKVIGKAEQTFHVLLSSISDHFELCLAKCRTSSSSVQHENSYRDPKAKHCYGEMPPMTSGIV